MWHKLAHFFRASLWENVEHLTVPGYRGLHRQRCRVCGATRVTDLNPQ